MARSPAVEQYIQLSKDLIEAATGYAGQTYNDNDTDAMLREIQVMTHALITALAQAAQVSSRRSTKPVPPPEPQPEPPKETDD